MLAPALFANRREEGCHGNFPILPFLLPSGANFFSGESRKFAFALWYGWVSRFRSGGKAKMLGRLGQYCLQNTEEKNEKKKEQWHLHT